MKMQFYTFFLVLICMYSNLNGMPATSQAANQEINKSKKAIIFGINGQDGAYLTEFLLNKNYEVHGVIRHSSLINTTRLNPFIQDSLVFNKRLFLHYGDLTDSMSIIEVIQTVKPDEIYNLAAQSQVRISFDIPEFTADVDALGTLRILEAIKLLNLTKTVKFYQASTSELYGLVQENPQTEKTPFYPRSPYGVAKLYGYWITVNYQRSLWYVCM